MNQEALKKHRLSGEAFRWRHPGANSAIWLPLRPAESERFSTAKPEYDRPILGGSKDRFCCRPATVDVPLLMIHLGVSAQSGRIKSFRKVGSPCAGHRDYDADLGFEMTTGPLGRASPRGRHAMARNMLPRNSIRKKQKSSTVHWGLVGDGCLQEASPPRPRLAAISVGNSSFLRFEQYHHRRGDRISFTDGRATR